MSFAFNIWRMKRACVCVCVGSSSDFWKIESDAVEIVDKKTPSEIEMLFLSCVPFLALETKTLKIHRTTEDH